MSDSLRYSIDAVYHTTDFSPASRVAFEHALRIAVANKSSFDIIHSDAGHLDRPNWRDFPEVRKTLAAWNLLEPGSPPAAVEAELGVHLRKIEVDEGDPAEGVARFLSDQQSGLLVLATQKRAGLPLWLKPSISGDIAQRALPQSVARDATIAALFVPADVPGFVASDTGDISLERVLVPVAKKPDPQAAIDTVGALLASLGCEPLWIEALHIGDEDSAPRTFPPAGFDESFMRATLHGNPVDEIVAAAERVQADLIAVATAGRHGFLDALRGSTAEQVVRRAPCPVLAVPDDDR